MKNFCAIFLFLFMMITSCSHTDKNSGQNNNPFFNEYTTPFQVPPFDLIKTSHFMPAFLEGMKQGEAEIQKIAENKEAPTFENTMAALDYSGKLLTRVSSVFFSLTDANTNDSIQKIQNEITPLLSKYSDNIYMNAALFKRIKTLYDEKDKLNLTHEQTRLLEKTYRLFVKKGANLDADKQKRLREINEQLSMLSVKFGDNLLTETKAFKLVIDKKEDLSGLSQSLIDAAASDAKNAKMEGKWVFTLDNSSIMPFLTYADNRDLREKMLKAYMNRSNQNNANDNKEVMKQLVNLRTEKANLLGYKNYASMMLENRMAKTPENAYALLTKIWDPALKTAQKDAAELQAYIKKEGKTFKLEPWDWRYYSEKIRKAKYDLDEEQIRPYLSLESVKQGAFTVANKLYGISFTEIKDIPKYHPDNCVYEVKDRDGSHLGVLYMDFFPRESKRGGAWCGAFRNQFKENGKNIRPVMTVVCNFTKPTANAPALLSFDEASTLFHEFGHSLQGLFSQVSYPGLNDLVQDYVELPSQVMENWAAEPEVLALYAKHYKTGEVMPKPLIDKLEKSKYFGQGFATVEYLAASILDMDYHTLPAPDAKLDITSFENSSMGKIKLLPEILPRYKTTYFRHISDDGYAAGYYVYVWAQVLDADAFQAFKDKGIFDQGTAKLFRENVLEKGSSEDEMEAYKKFRGAEPSIEPLLKRKGF